MDTLVLGLCIFFAIHLLPSLTSLHAAIKNKLGGKAFKGVFALISFLGLGLIILGMGEVEFTPLYEPPAWGRHVTSLLMLIALYCLISSEAKTSIRMITAHPMLWGISAWATGHLLANGDQASFFLFGSFLTYSLFAMFSANRRGARPTGEALALKTDAIVLLAAALVCIGLMFFHDSIAGVPILG
jgi:uncharacterized membrane protein